MHTDKYMRLKNRLNKLKRVYLPGSFSPTGTYSDTVYEKGRAYTVLSHAEMEYYFEEIALSIAEKAYKKWTQHQKASKPLLALVAYYDGKYSSIPDAHDGNRSDETMDERIRKAYTSYNKQVRDKNNGIKEADILKVFLPVGINISEIDENLLIALNNFGKQRGDIAHSTKSPNLTTPDDALNTVNEIMNLIDSFDTFMHQYRSNT